MRKQKDAEAEVETTKVIKSTADNNLFFRACDKMLDYDQ